ncbi:MAG: lipid-A-disaccharide synthase [Lautropia sp.]|nr:lipid-A-disaccharide synthase [Lautropia sp.]
MDTRIGMVAGEASGDLLASSVLTHWRQLAEGDRPRCAGIGGPKMQAEGFDAWWPSEWLAVHGYAAAIKALPKLLWVRHRLFQRLQSWPATAFIGVDAPDFNLGLEERLKAGGIRTYHFVSPSIWAWRRERIEKIRRAADHMLLVFPFESEIYREAGIPATYVGHPLADQIPFEIDRQAARVELGLPPDAIVIALMPGSRAAEIEYLAPVFLQTAAALHKRHPDWQFILPAAGAERREQLRTLIEPLYRDLPIEVLDGQSHTALAACDQTLIASGTATLEAALFKRPMVIAYRLAPMSYHLMKTKAYQPWFGLPNILAAEFLVPEFIQDAATPDVLSQAVEQQIDDIAGRERLVARFLEMHQSLACGCAERVASTVMADLRG